MARNLKGYASLTGPTNVQKSVSGKDGQCEEVSPAVNHTTVAVTGVQSHTTPTKDGTMR